MRTAPKTDRMSTREATVAKLKAHEAELRDAGIVSLALFGSVARGEDRPESDVDVVVRLDPDAHIGFRIVGLERRVGDLVGRPVQMLTEPITNARLRGNVERDRHRVF